MPQRTLRDGGMTLAVIGVIILTGVVIKMVYDLHEENKEVRRLVAEAQKQQQLDMERMKK